MTPMDDVARELGLLLRSLKGLHVPLVVDGGARVEMPAAAVLATLDDRGRLRLSTLAELLHLDLSSVSRQVATLVEEGWVSRERDPADSRAWLLELTATGRDVLARVRAADAELSPSPGGAAVLKQPLPPPPASWDVYGQARASRPPGAAVYTPARPLPPPASAPDAPVQLRGFIQQKVSADAR